MALDRHAKSNHGALVRYGIFRPVQVAVRSFACAYKYRQRLDRLICCVARNARTADYFLVNAAIRFFASSD
jgi:hypothetical protein